MSRKKLSRFVFCQNCLKFSPILIIFGRKMANGLNICELHSFSTSPNLRHHLTVLNANVPNSMCTDTGAADTWLHTSDTVAAEFARPQPGRLQRLEFCRRKFIVPKLLTSMNSKRVSSTSGRSSTSRSLMPRSASGAAVSALVSVHGAHFEHKFWQFWTRVIGTYNFAE